MSDLPTSIGDMCGLMVDLAPGLHFALGSERGPGWARTAVKAMAALPDHTNPPDCPVLSVWLMDPGWRFCLRSPVVGADQPRGHLRDRAHLAALLASLEAP